MRFTEVENERCAHAGTRRELDEANDRSAELEVALERYGLHESECNKIMAWHDPDELKTYQSCSCGLHDVLGFDPALREGPTPTIDRNLTIERLRDENTAIRRASRIPTRHRPTARCESEGTEPTII